MKECLKWLLKISGFFFTVDRTGYGWWVRYQNLTAWPTYRKSWCMGLASTTGTMTSYSQCNFQNFTPIYRVCKHCQFVFPSSVLSVMSVSGFPLIIMSAHAQCSMCTCSVEGIPSLVCPHMLSVSASLISMQCKHCSMWQTHGKQWRIFGEDEEKVKNPSSSPQNPSSSPQNPSSWLNWHNWTQTQTDSGDLLRFTNLDEWPASNMPG